MNVTTFKFQLKDIINVTSTWAMLEKGSKVAHIWRAQHNEFVLSFFELTALENFTNVVITIIEHMFCKKGFCYYSKRWQIFWHWAFE
jgi:hypothetical protein